MKRTILNFCMIATVSGAIVGIASDAVSQDLQSIGAEKIPYVLFVLDTSGSTEWTDKGNERYPELDPPVPPNGVVEWQAGLRMDVYNPSNPMGSSVSDGPVAFGPCFVWEPESCDDYRRPAYFVGSGEASFFSGTGSNIDDWDPRATSSTMATRFDRMRGVGGSNGVRLDGNSQPRHVTLKEILSGQMVLAPEGYAGGFDTLSPSTHGPGCWFVRRQIGASVQPADEQDYCQGDPDNFRGLPDFDEPRPHFQEVISATKPNSGILKKFAQNAVFGVAFMDGFPFDIPGWNPDDLNDDIEGDMGDNMPSNDYRDSSAPYTQTEEDSGEEAAGRPYNLGVYRIATPTQINIESTSVLQQLSSFIQATVNEAGMIGDDDFRNPDLSTKAAGGSRFNWLGLNFDKGARNLMEEYRMGSQPIAKATPMAAAIADVHQFFANDDRFKETGSDGDPFARCRQKNVVLITDGTPDPEREDGADDLGSSGLTAAFGLNEVLYPYSWAEEEIDQFVNNTNILPPMGDPGRVRYGPRVHVVSMDVEQDPTRRGMVARKLASMALEGNTCASAAMPDKVQPGCNPATTWCLVDQPSGTWNPPNGGTEPCEDPAVMLTSNDPEALEQAIDAVFGSIVDTTASRTRTAVTNNLDDASISQGGQYRFFSATNASGGTFWRGILNRETLPCTDSGATNADTGINTGGIQTDAFHLEIANQIGNCDQTGCDSPTDNRRIFTSVPSSEIYDYALNRPTTYTLPIRDTETSGGDELFHWSFDLETSDVDEFNGTSLPDPNEATLLENTRVPFFRTHLESALNSVGVTGSDFFDYWGTDPVDTSTFTNLVDTYRGRIFDKAAVTPPRVLGALQSSDPVTVEPPSLDLPIESYRAFRARYGDRPTMLYFSTTDGLLHGVHAGRLETRLKVRSFDAGKGTDSDATGTMSAADQREAWAYLPHMMHRKLASSVFSQPYLNDGPPTVKDVRLCQPNPEDNQSLRACGVISNASAPTLTAEQQWRTVLVQGLGAAGQGYFALDVTRPGGLRPGEATRTLDNPDPIPLWEFDRNWEKQQIDFFKSVDELARVGPDGYDPAAPTTPPFVDPDGACGSDSAWEQALLGTSISKPEIATVQVLSPQETGPPVLRQRPVAVFGGGARVVLDGECGEAVAGQAIYVVDLQTGTILRRFVDYADGANRSTFHQSGFLDSDGNPERIAFTGSPAVFNSFTGALATRGFIGGSNGALFKMDFSDPDPLEWDVSLFFDPSESPVNLDPADLGVAGFKPAVARAPDKSLVVTYGLGDPRETTETGTVQAVFTLSENPATLEADIRWFQVFEDGEKMTGDPIIFNRVTYFPTYKIDTGDLCSPGTARIWALDYFESSGNDPIGQWDKDDPRFGAGLEVDDPDGKWFGPTEASLIRGLTLTAGPTCSVRGLGTNSQDTSGIEGADAQPQLIAQTSGASGSSLGSTSGSGDDAVSRLVIDIEKPRSMTVPLSWSVIGN